MSAKMMVVKLAATNGVLAAFTRVAGSGPLDPKAFFGTTGGLRVRKGDGSAALDVARGDLALEEADYDEDVLRNPYGAVEDGGTVSLPIGPVTATLVAGGVSVQVTPAVGSSVPAKSKIWVQAQAPSQAPLPVVTIATTAAGAVNQVVPITLVSGTTYSVLVSVAGCGSSVFAQTA